MIETIDGVAVKLLGDQHLGRRFRNGVPLHRLGDRERMVREQFIRELDPQGALLHVNMGDLFDKFVVPLDMILFAAREYREAAAISPQTSFVVIRGNHDAARDLDRTSAFDIFAELVRGVKNITVVRELTTSLGINRSCFGFVPWHPFKPAKEMAAWLGVGQTAVFGHWDTKNFGGDDSNLLPYDLLRGLTKQVYTGHVHKPERFDASGLEVVVVGSMQPYAHGECADNDPAPMYFTTTPDELEGVDVSDRCVRLILPAGAPIPEVDCLQLVIKREGQEGEESIDVEMGDFSMETLFTEAFSEGGVEAGVMAEVFGRYKELTNVQASDV